ncbi:alpha/beta-Hydrolases superfamily protein [Striga hermonthica]|uniref:Alpha/beta-Hydrolases superfamily protein n=1 Tax=Striga hermonthica TaxID=68872 RepID=A0A9N7RH50_STRHE|nr:alpha/beta-Hydrolases superfamily protein [Striga hermonthica]
MAAGTSRRISAASARVHTRKSKPSTSSKISGMFKKILFVSFVGLLAWLYQSTIPPKPKTCGSPNGPPITAQRLQLKDGRFLAYTEFGVPKDKAKHKIVFVHGFDCCKHDFSAITSQLSSDIVENEGVYIVSFDRPGYGESDPNPKQTVNSTAFDIEELADHLGLGSKFYIVGFSLGGQIVWTCLKYIPHRLAGAVLLAPAVNYWWPGLSSNVSREAYKQQLPEDQWAMRVAHYVPWLNYWWNTQKLFPGFSLIAQSPRVLSYQDAEIIPRVISIREEYQAQVRQQGEFESLHRDLAFMFGTWDFDPTDLKNPFSENVDEGPFVHLWHGDEDRIVPVTLQQDIARKLPWVHYHELTGAGHMFPFADGMDDFIITTLLAAKK